MKTPPSRTYHGKALMAESGKETTALSRSRHGRSGYYGGGGAASIGRPPWRHATLPWSREHALQFHIRVPTVSRVGRDSKVFDVLQPHCPDRSSCRGSATARKPRSRRGAPSRLQSVPGKMDPLGKQEPCTWCLEQPSHPPDS